MPTIDGQVIMIFIFQVMFTNFIQFMYKMINLIILFDFYFISIYHIVFRIFVFKIEAIVKNKSCTKIRF